LFRSDFEEEEYIASMNRVRTCNDI
jgi:hypothetical protein